MGVYVGKQTAPGAKQILMFNLKPPPSCESPNGSVSSGCLVAGRSLVCTNLRY